MGRPGQQLSDDALAGLFLAAMLAVAVAAWVWWPQISAVVSRPPAGAPRPGEDCVLLDWDEWARPLYDCRPGPPGGPRGDEPPRPPELTPHDMGWDDPPHLPEPEHPWP